MNTDVSIAKMYACRSEMKISSIITNSARPIDPRIVAPPTASPKTPPSPTIGPYVRMSPMKARMTK